MTSSAEAASHRAFREATKPDVRYLFALVRRDWWLLALTGGLALVAAVLLTMFAMPRYVASAAIQINDTSTRVLGSEDEAGEAEAINRLDTERFLRTQVDVLSSRGLALRVAQKLKLDRDAKFLAAQGEAAEAGAGPAQLRNQIVKLLMENLAIDLPRDSRVVTVSYSSSDPALSALVANTYVEEFIQSNLQRKFDSSSYARDFVSKQLGEAKSRLEQSELALNGYARSAGLINTRSAFVSDSDDNARQDRGSSVTTSSLIELNTAANGATARRILAESRWRAINSGPLLSASEVLSNTSIAAMISQRATIQAELNQDRVQRLADYPSVRSRQAQLDALNGQIQSAAANVRNSVRADYNAAVAAEAELAGQVEKLKNATLAEQDRTVQYGLLAREADTNRQVYDGLLQRFKQLNAAAGISLSNVSVIDRAEPPVLASSPSLTKNLAIGVLAGLVLAAVILFVRHEFDDAVRVPEDIEAKLGLTLLGVIPRVAGESLAEALLDPKTPISEAYNSLRAGLLYSTPDGSPSVLLFTSAQASEGKTTSASATAAGFAKLGKRTLLIDADLRKPSLHRVAGLANEQGLSTLLTSREPLNSAVAGSGQENLSLLSSGPIPPSPTELVSSLRMEELLAQASREYEVVVIDSPPILGLADAPILAALADGVVFIIEAERSRRGALKGALRRLRATHPILLGAVLSKFDPGKFSNRYSEYYGYEQYRYEDAPGTA